MDNVIKNEYKTNIEKSITDDFKFKLVATEINTSTFERNLTTKINIFKKKIEKK
tara:strand:+ start:67 stop:228 length:162 start_codon:yes stop_codon:yes gene_type:complete